MAARGRGLNMGWELVIAMLLDAVFGEPRMLWDRLPHPAILMGRLIAFLDRIFNTRQDRKSKTNSLLFPLAARGGREVLPRDDGLWFINHRVYSTGSPLSLSLLWPKYTSRGRGGPCCRRSLLPRASRRRRGPRPCLGKSRKRRRPPRSPSGTP